MNFINSVIIPLLIGVISGIISSAIVYFFFQRVERKEHLKRYWITYIMNCYNSADLNIPVELLEMLKPMGGLKSEFGQAIIAIYDIKAKASSENRELSDEELELSRLQKIAVEEYHKIFSRKSKRG